MGSVGFSQKSLVFHGKLTEADLAQINKCRGKENRLGFAYQVIFIKLFNKLPQIQPLEITEEVLIYTSIQLGIESSNIDGYASNRYKISDHQQVIIEYLELKDFIDDSSDIDKFLYDEALRLESISLLKSRVIQYLKDQKILCPNDDTLNRLITNQRKKSKELYI